MGRGRGAGEVPGVQQEGGSHVRDGRDVARRPWPGLPGTGTLPGVAHPAGDPEHGEDGPPGSQVPGHPGPRGTLRLLPAPGGDWISSATSEQATR